MIVQESASFGMNIFRGRIASEQVFPYPEVLTNEHREMLQMILPPTEKFFEEINNADKSDAQGFIDKDVLAKFAELGAFGAVVPAEYEGAGMNNTQMARLAEIVGANDLAIGVTMGAHQVRYLCI
jgi:very long chain acyl-CoA dehydrogenase